MEEAELSGLSLWIIQVVDSLGYVGLAGLVALENLLPPVPSELILPLAGFHAGRGEFSLPIAIVAATVGSLLGALVLYEVGRRVGEERIRAWTGKHGRWVLLEVSDLDRAHGWFDRHGRSAVLVGRIIPGVRSFISIPAGVKRMPLAAFCLYTVLGSAVWNTVLISLGYYFGNRWEQVREYASLFERVVWGGFAVALAIFIFKRVRTLRSIPPGKRRSEA